SKPSTIRRQINDEVETIVLKCLQKERERRYQSAGELARDVEHFLTGEAIEAKRDSAAYVLRKHLRKYRLPLAVAAAFLLVLTGGLVASVSFWRQAAAGRDRAVMAEQEQTRERQRADAERDRALAAEAHATTEAERARREAAKVTQIQEFLQNMLASVDPQKAKGADVTVREVLDEAAQRIGAQLGDHPAVEAAVRHTIGLTYSHLGRLEQAKEQFEIAVALRRDSEIGDELELATSLRHLADLAEIVDRDVTRSRSLYEEALAIRERRLGKEHPLTVEVLTDLAATELIARQESAVQGLTGEVIRRITGSMSSDEELFADLEQWLDELSALWREGRREEALNAVRSKMRPYVDSGLATQNLWGMLISGSERRQSAGDYDAAEPLLREAVRMAREAENPVLISDALEYLGSLLRHRKQACTEAVACFSEVLDLRAEFYGTDHEYTLTARQSLATAMAQCGRLSEAEQYYREALAGYRRAKGADDSDTLALISHLATMVYHQGRVAEAERLYAEAVEGARHALPEGHEHTGIYLWGHGLCLTKLERYPEAETALLEAHGILAGANRPEHKRTVSVAGSLALLYEVWGKPEPAEQYRREDLAGWRGTLGDEHTTTRLAIVALAKVLRGQGKLDEAERYYREALAGYRSAGGDDHPNTLATMTELAWLLGDRGKFQEAERLLREALAIRRKQQPRDDNAVDRLLAWRGMMLNGLAQYPEAEAVLRECLAIRQNTLPEDHWAIFNAMSMLGESLAGQGKFGEAQPLLLDSYVKLHEDAEAIPEAYRTMRVREALERIVDLYDAWHEAEPGEGYDAKAAEWRAKLEQWQATTRPAAG
ncbi:MAG: tetratricopeptide repeat protein, partial [Planctomycetota bacterium]